MHASPTTRIAFLRWKPVVWFEFGSSLWFWSWLRIGMVLGSGSHSDLRFQWQIHGSIVLVIFKCHRLAGRNRLAVSCHRGPVLLITTLPRTVDRRVPPLKSIMLDQRRGQKVGPCLGKATSGTWWRPAMIYAYGFCQSTRSCVLPCPRAIADDLCLVGTHMLRVVRF